LKYGREVGGTMPRVRRASGGREEALLKAVEGLRRSVAPLLPERTRDCPPEPFERLEARFEEIRSFREDARRLDRLRRWGEPFGRALAGFYRFYLEPELPALVPARVGGSEVAFAPLARAPAEYQIAVQQYADPRRLLLGYLRMARKGWYFYALPDRLLCPGRDARPPGEFLRKQDAGLPYRFERAPDGGGTYLCPHLAQGERVPWLGVEWASAGRSFRICSGCARDDAQLLGAVGAGLAQPKADRAFGVVADLNVDCRGGPDCPHQQLPGLSRGLERRYVAGRLSDRELLQQFARETEPAVAGAGRRVLMAGGVCFGTNAAAFLDALHPNRVERAALEKVLPRVDGLFAIPDPTASQALERLWRGHAEAIVAAIERDPEEAARLVAEARASPGRVSELLRRAAQRAAEREVLAALPQYSQLAPEAVFVDEVARSYRVGGHGAAERRIEQALPREGKQRGIAWGLLLALGRSAPHTWQFSETERKFGESLELPARALLEVPPSDYDRALGELLAVAGVTGPRS
jgi:hypothetical protein